MRSMAKVRKGSFRVWWLTHRERVQTMLTLGTIVLALGMVGRWDYEDALEQEKAAHAAVKADLARHQAVHGVPSVVWLVESSTPEEARLKLAKVAGELDVARNQLRGK
jgi:hypothetical protein